MRGFCFLLAFVAVSLCLAAESQAAIFGRRGGGCSSGSGCSTSSGSQGCNIQKTAPVSVIAPPVAAPLQQATVFAPRPEPARIARISRSAALIFCQPSPEQAAARALIAFK